MADSELADLLKVREFVDDDLASCFLWAAGEKAMDKANGLDFDGVADPYGLLANLDTAAGLGADGEGGAGGSGEGSGSNTGGKKDQKVQLRMARKAQAARDARRRHKSYVQGLEGDVAKLQADIAAARAKAAQRKASAPKPSAPQAPAAGAAAVPAGAPAGGGALAGADEKGAHLNQMELLLRRRSVEQLQPEANQLIERYVGSKRSRESVMLGCAAARHGGAVTVRGPAREPCSEPRRASRLASAPAPSSRRYVEIIEELLEPSALVALAFSNSAGSGKEGGKEPGTPKREPREVREGNEGGKEGKEPKLSVGSAMLRLIATELSLSPPQMDALVKQRAKIHSVRTRKRRRAARQPGRGAPARSPPSPCARAALLAAGPRDLGVVLQAGGGAARQDRGSHQEPAQGTRRAAPDPEPHAGGKVRHVGREEQKADDAGRRHGGGALSGPEPRLRRVYRDHVRV